MAITNYSELQTALQSWLVNDSLDGKTTDIISLAEGELNARLASAEPFPPRPMETRTTITVDAEYENQPIGFIMPKSVAITGLEREWWLKFTSDDNLTRMKVKEAEFIAARAMETALNDVPPEYYAIVGSELRFFPEPTISYTVAMTYFKRLPALSVSNTTNWLLTDFPNAYLTACLMVASDFIESSEGVAKYSAALDTVISLVLASYPTPRDNAPLQSEVPIYTAYRRTVLV